MDRIEITTQILAAIISTPNLIGTPQSCFNSAIEYTNLIADYYGLDQYPIKEVKSNSLDEDRLTEMAELEEGCDISVGGLMNKEKHG